MRSRFLAEQEARCGGSIPRPWDHNLRLKADAQSTEPSKHPLCTFNSINNLQEFTQCKVFAGSPYPEHLQPFPTIVTYADKLTFTISSISRVVTSTLSSITTSTLPSVSSCVDYLIQILTQALSLSASLPHFHLC